MTPEQGSALAPLVIVAATAVVVMLALAFSRRHLLAVFLTLIGLATALAACLWAWRVGDQQLTMLLALDGYARFMHAFFIITALLLVLLSYPYLQRHETQRGEYYVLLLLATLGAMALASSTHFASFFLSLELLSISLYGLIAYRATRATGVEAAMKYLIMASVSSGFLLFGMALIYARYGTMQLGELAGMVGDEAELLPGLVLILVGVGFKLALVPFHTWAPDVYQGAPAPVAGFITTISKAGMFALVLRYFAALDLSSPLLLGLLVLIAILSMTFGNLLALQQANLKRLLAYSSISHMGYLLVTLLVAGLAGGVTAIFYLVTYFAAVLTAFGVIGVLSLEGDELEDVREYHGLAWRRPWLAALLTASMFSLAGLPLTAGFLGKFLLITVGVARMLWVPMFALAINSAIGLYYYLRVVSRLYAPREAAAPAPRMSALAGLATGVAFASLGLAILWLGIHPTPMLTAIQEVVIGLVR